MAKSMQGSPFLLDDVTGRIVGVKNSDGSESGLSIGDSEGTWESVRQRIVSPAARYRHPGVVFSDPSSRVAADYQVVGVGSAIAMDSSVRRNGTQTLKVTLNRGSATTTDLNILHAVAAQLEYKGRVGVWVYVPDYTLLSSIVVKVSLGDATYTNGAFQTYNFSDGEKAYNGWHFIAFDLGEWGGAYGTPNWATQAVSAVRLTLGQNSAAQTSVYVDQYCVGWNSRARLLITADDGYASWFTRGLPVVDSYGLKATMSIIGAQVGSNATWATLQHLRDAYAKGHDLSPHGATALSSLADNAARLADIRANVSYLQSRGMTRGLRYYVYPNGVYQLSAGDQTIINMLKAEGFACARGTTVPRWSKAQGDDFSDGRWVMPVIGADATTPVSTITGYVDNLVTYGAVGTLMYHEIVLSGATGGTQRNVADLIGEMSYIADLVAQGKLIVLTASEFISGQRI